MGARRVPIVAIVLSWLLLWSAAPATAGAPVTCDLGANGTFRFLTDNLPNGSTNAEYVARLLTANADGAVTFALDGGDALPPGMTLAPASGFITGRPTSTFNEDLTFSANDGVATIQTTINLKVNAAGGGGNGGVTFDTSDLPEGAVGALYTASLALDDAGVGPFVFGASDLPPGVTLDGETGVISGVPTAAGTFFATLSAFDFGEDNKVVTVLPIVILPAGSEFRFLTEFLNNGEVGTPYCDTWLTENGSGVVFGATGLPAGLALDPATGVVSGTPTVPGTFFVVLTATSGGVTITTNLSLVIAAGAASDFHWNFFGLPSAIVNASYDRQPPILVAAEGNEGDVTYSVIGLPVGMTYSTTSGELSGTPIEIGEYPLTFTAVDAANNETLTLSVTFLVLPPGGGDVSQIPVNFWVVKESLKLVEPGKDAWRVSGIYNADRRVANRFDPAVDTMLLQIGTRSLALPPGSLTGKTEKAYAWRSAKGAVPVESVKLGPAKQTIAWTTKADTISEVVPGVLVQTVTIGPRGYRLLLAFDENGAFHPALDFERTAFVVRTGKLTKKGPGDDSAKLSLLLADPNFAYEAQTSPLRIRLLDGTTVLLDRDFTALGDVANVTTDARTGSLVFAFKTLKDTATTDRVVKFNYQSGSGKMTLGLAGLDLAAMANGETHLGVELTIGLRTYYTAVTVFEGKTGSGRYSTTMP
jgi:Putative Ig domain